MLLACHQLTSHCHLSIALTRRVWRTRAPPGQLKMNLKFISTSITSTSKIRFVLAGFHATHIAGISYLLPNRREWLIKLTWLATGVDQAARSRRAEQVCDVLGSPNGRIHSKISGSGDICVRAVTN